MRRLTTLLIVAGVYVSHSRGPWLTAVVVYLVYSLLAPGGVRAIAKSLAAGGMLAAGLALTPIGERVASTLPFIGTVEQNTIAERQRLAEVSWALIQEHPVFGDPFVLNQMQELSWGQGFVDLMNGYAAITLFTGFAGLALFAGFFFGALAMAYVARHKIRRVDADMCSIGAALIAAMLGSAIFIATAAVDWIEYVLVGMSVAYAALAVRQAPASPQPGGAFAPPRAAGIRKRLPS